MKLAIERSVLAAAIGRARKAVKPSPVIPICNTLRLEGADNRLHLRAYDLEIEYRETVEASVETEGVTCASIDKLHGIASNAPEGAEIALSHEASQLKVSAGRARFKISTLPVEDWPETVETEDRPKLILDAPVFLGALKRCLRSVASDSDPRSYYRGVALYIHEGDLVAVGADGCIASRCVLSLTGPDPLPEGGIILPTQAAKALIGIFANSESVTIWASESLFGASDDTRQLRTKLIDAAIPNYEGLFGRTKKPDGHCTAFMRADLVHALARVEPFGISAASKTSAIGLDANDEGLRILAGENSEDGTDVIDAEVSESWRAGFNSRYLRAGLEAAGADKIEIYYSTDGPSLLIDPTDESFRFFIMPMRYRFPPENAQP